MSELVKLITFKHLQLNGISIRIAYSYNIRIWPLIFYKNVHRSRNLHKYILDTYLLQQKIKSQYTHEKTETVIYT